MANQPSDIFKYYAIGPDDECWPYIGKAWGGSNREPRPYFQADGRRQIAYRWVYELYNGTTLTSDQLVLHSCDNGGYPIGCGNPHHMHVGTHQQNMDEMVDRERHGMPKSVVRAIRKLLSEGVTQQEIADRYGVVRKTISWIAIQQTHKTVD